MGVMVFVARDRTGTTVATADLDEFWTSSVRGVLMPPKVATRMSAQRFQQAARNPLRINEFALKLTAGERLLQIKFRILWLRRN